MKYLLAILLMTLSVLPMVMGSNYQEKQLSNSAPLNTTYCELVRAPDKYDGQEIIIYATFSYGFEEQYLRCLECSDAGPIWLDLNEDTPPKVDKELKKMPKDAGTVNAEFTGVFVSSGGPYGDGRTRLKLVVSNIKNVKVIYKGLPPPGVDLREKMCGGGSETYRRPE
jgi:hypothetical protein